MIKVLKWVFFSVIFFLNIETVYSQAYNFSIYSVNEGLPHAQVADVIQTSDGYIWIATSGGGVSRFDGHTFETYTIEHGLRDDFINTIYEDSEKRIWVGTYYGGVSYLKNDRFVNPFDNHPINDFYVTSFTESPDYDSYRFQWKWNSIRNHFSVDK